MITTDNGLLISFTFNHGIPLNLMKRRNRGTIKAAKGTIMDSKIKLNTLSLAFDLYITKAYPAAEETTIARRVVTTAITREFLNAVPY